MSPSFETVLLFTLGKVLVKRLRKDYLKDSAPTRECSRLWVSKDHLTLPYPPHIILVRFEKLSPNIRAGQCLRKPTSRPVKYFPPI